MKQQLLFTRINISRKSRPHEPTRRWAGKSISMIELDGPQKYRNSPRCSQLRVFSGVAAQRLSRQFAMSILWVRRFVLRRSETGTTNTFLTDKLPFGDSCPVGERAWVGTRLKVQAKAKLDQISGVRVPRESVVQDTRLEVWSR